MLKEVTIFRKNLKFVFFVQCFVWCIFIKPCQADLNDQMALEKLEKESLRDLREAIKSGLNGPADVQLRELDFSLPNENEFNAKSKTAVFGAIISARTYNGAALPQDLIDSIAAKARTRVLFEVRNLRNGTVLYATIPNAKRSICALLLKKEKNPMSPVASGDSHSAAFSSNMGSYCEPAKDNVSLNYLFPLAFRVGQPVLDTREATKTFLFKNCKKSITSNRFRHSYCEGVILGFLAGHATARVNMDYALAQNFQEAICIPDGISPIDIARHYIQYAEQTTDADKAENNEQMSLIHLATSISKFYKCHH